MARVAYDVDDVLGQICHALGIDEYYELIGGHYTFADHDAATEAAYSMIWGMLEDDNTANDDTAYEYFDLLQTSNHTIMYWSTETSKWY